MYFIAEYDLCVCLWHFTHPYWILKLYTNFFQLCAATSGRIRVIDMVITHANQNLTLITELEF